MRHAAASPHESARILRRLPTLLAATAATVAAAITLAAAAPTIASPLTLRPHPFTRSIDLRARLELGLDVTPQPSNPFDPAEMRVELELRPPSGGTTTVGAYWFQDFERGLAGSREVLTPRGEPYWKAAYTPSEPGRWRWRWTVATPAASRVTRWHDLVVTSRPAGPGFLRVSPRDPRYLVHDDGTPYFAIGENLAWYDRRGTRAYDDWLDELAAQGATWIRVWMPEHGMGIEADDTGLGDYTARLDRAWQLDYVFTAAAERGIAIQLVLLHHSAFSTEFGTEWATNPYNAANGGPLASPEQFFTDPVARSYFERRLRYVVARFGARTNLLAWELWNEVDLTDRYDSATVTAWHRDFAALLRSLDPARHPITTSFLYFFNDPAVVNGAGLDLVQQHFYSRSDTVPLFPDLARVAVDFPRARHAQYGRPVLMAELGIGSGPDDTLALDPEGIAVHDGLWAGPFGEAMGTSMPWWWRLVIDVEPERYYPMFGSVSAFLRDVAWDREGFVARDPAVTTASGRAVRAHALVGEDTALLWVKDGDVRYYMPGRVTIDDAEVALDALPGTWSAAWWDTWAGAWYATATVEGGPGRTLAVPSFAADTAVRLVKIKAEGGGSRHYKCYRVEETRERCAGDTGVACTADQDCADREVDGPCLGFPPGVTATLGDQLEAKRFDVARPGGLCTPVGVDGEDLGDPLLHLVRHGIRRARSPVEPPHVRRTIRTKDRYGQHVLQTIKEESLLVPAHASPDAPTDPPGPEHDLYKCYRVREVKRRCAGDPATRCRSDADCAPAGATCSLGLANDVHADLRDPFEHKVFAVKRPTLVCLPAAKDGDVIRIPAALLSGYRIEVPSSGPRHVRVPEIHLSSRDDGPAVVSTIAEDLLLVPSREVPPASPGGT